ncbi:hypothetical protein BSPWISOXPB_2263 [uncultured Gammaproteobacteria bacterium]|nr:hypothetical protein BSPWISOXPB_2263 [uncultured Gammaproteobacteria bacterium]
MGEKLDAAVEIDVARDVILDRLTTRRTCTGCGEIYNVNPIHLQLKVFAINVVHR